MPMRVASGDAGSQEGVIVMFRIAWECDVLICINPPFLTQCVLKHDDHQPIKTQQLSVLLRE
jgi:hypothetical protein